jgi:hypothetical protein
VYAAELMIWPEGEKHVFLFTDGSFNKGNVCSYTIDGGYTISGVREKLKEHNINLWIMAYFPHIADAKELANADSSAWLINPGDNLNESFEAVAKKRVKSKAVCTAKHIWEVSNYICEEWEPQDLDI